MPSRKTATADPIKDGASPEESERLVREREGQQESEVKAEEFTRGTADPVGKSALPDAVVDELKKALDPERVRRREGSGGRSLEYLAGHDVKRRANEIFGFGNWGYIVEELVHLDSVEVVGRDATKKGWYVGYRCTVEVWVNTLDGRSVCSDVGYGDGVEYTGPKAKIAATELAIKEAVTDGLKRALTSWGDQFGLILYAKGDEKQRIVRDQARTEVRDAPATPVPRNWGEGIAMFASLLGDKDGARERDEVVEWTREAMKALYNVEARADLGPAQLQNAFQRFASTVLLLWEESDGDLTFRQGRELRGMIADAFASRWDGIALVGPAWRLGPDEEDKPSWDETQHPARVA